MKYRDNNYFNEVDTFKFKLNDSTIFECKVHFFNGNWFTNEGLNWKCTSLRCVKL